MSSQQDIYAGCSESRPPMLNKENYVPWSSRLLRYAKSRPNGKLIHNFILNGPYVKKLIPEPGDANRDITVTETFYLQIDDELSDKELKQIEADDQAIQTILLGLPEDIYAAVDSCKTAQEICLRVQQIMKGSDIGIQEKKAKLFNEWEMFTSNEGESIESYYHCFLKLMNDLKRNKHFPEKIASNLKFLNNLQPEWSQHVTIVHQTKDLHTADYTQLYDFLKYNQKDVDELKDERLAKTQDPLALMANSNNPYVFPAPHQDQSSFKQNYLQQPMTNSEDITDPITKISSNPRNRLIAQPSMNMGQGRQTQMVGGNGGNQFRQYGGQNAGNPAGYNDNGLIGVQGNGNLVAVRAEGNAAGQNGNQIRCYNCRGEEAGIQLQAEEYDLMAVAADLDEIEEVIANCILMANLQQASTSGTQTDSAPVYDTDGSAEVHENCDDNEIFNMFTQEEQYTELLKPIPESHQVLHNDNDVISEDTSVEQGIEVEKVNSVNRKLKETNADLTTELARFKNQERCFEISQGKYDKLEKCYQQSVYLEQCLSKKINALQLSSGKQIMTLNEQLSKEKSTVSFLLEEKKRLKSDFKTCEDNLLDKQILLEKRIKELNNIMLKTGQSIQTIHMLSPKPNSFYHTEQKMALGYHNPFYLKQAQKKQQRVFVPQKALSCEESYFSNNSKMANVSKSFLIPNEDLSDDNTPSVARKFLNEVKSTILTLQRVVKQRMTIETHNWASSAHQELYKIRLQSLAKKADDSLVKHKALELEIERLLKSVVSQDIMIIVQNESIVDTSDL
nr:hypothetical protein [Tanacetum cinerariifolium]